MALNTTVTGGTMNLSTRSQLWDAISSQKKFFIGSKIYELAPEANPYLAMLGHLPGIKMDGPDKAFVEHRSAIIDAPKFTYHSGTLTFTAGNPTTPTSYSTIVLYPYGTTTAATAKELPVGSVVQFVNENDKSQFANLLVTVNGGSNVTLALLTSAPGFNPTADTTVCYLRGTAFGEGADKATSAYETPNTRWFGTQIFKETIEISNTLKESKDLVYGSELEMQMRNALMRHNNAMDKAMLHSGSRVGATNGDPFSAAGTNVVDAGSKNVRSTLSLYQACKSQSSSSYGMGGARIFTNTASTMTYGDLLDNLQEQFEFHQASATKYAFAGAGFLTSLNKLALRTGEYKLMAGETEFGLKCYILDSPHGQLKIIRHIGMRDEWTNAMAVVDPANIAIGTFRPTSWRGIETSTDSTIIEYVTEAGLMVRLPETHGFWFFL